MTGDHPRTPEMERCYPCQERWRVDEPCWRWWVENYRGELVVHGPGVPPNLSRGAYRKSDRLIECSKTV